MRGNRANFLLNTFLRPEVFVYIAFLVFTASFFLLNSSIQNGGPASLQGGQDIVKHYLNLNGPRMVWTLILVCIALFIHGVVLWVRALIRQTDPAAVFTRENAVRFFRRVRAVFRELIVIGIPFAVAFSSLSMALGPLNVFNANRLRDELLFKWDVLLTGTFPPLALSSLRYPAWFVSAVEFSFYHLVPVLTIFSAYLFVARSRLFREAAGAFFLGLIMLYVGWLAFPVLSPHDRFIDNVYDLPTVEAVQPYLEEYQPQEEIVSFLRGMRESKEGLSVLPTSTFPSAHVAWATLLVYYAWRLQRWLGLIAFPFAATSSLGTFFFAQHYFVDLPAGILVSVFSIWVVHWLMGKQSRYEAP